MGERKPNNEMPTQCTVDDRSLCLAQEGREQLAFVGQIEQRQGSSPTSEDSPAPASSAASATIASTPTIASTTTARMLAFWPGLIHIKRAPAYLGSI